MTAPRRWGADAPWLKWDSGRRQARWTEREELELKERVKRHSRLEERLYRRYGTHWPKGLIEKFKEREKNLYGEVDRLEDERWEPWFPDALIESIQTTTSVHPRKRDGLLQALWDALDQLKDARIERDRGLPMLDGPQQAKLRRIEAAASKLLAASGPDVEATQHLIGNWAEAGLLNGQTYIEVMRSVSALHLEVSLRLDQAPAIESHRPRDVACDRFYRDVVKALKDADIPVKMSRDGVFAKLVHLLLTAANEQHPTDLFRRLKKAVTVQ